MSHDFFKEFVTQSSHLFDKVILKPFAVQSQLFVSFLEDLQKLDYSLSSSAPYFIYKQVLHTSSNVPNNLFYSQM